MKIHDSCRHAGVASSIVIVCNYVIGLKVSAVGRMIIGIPMSLIPTHKACVPNTGIK